MILGWILRIVLALIVLRMLLRLLHGVFQGLKGAPVRGPIGGGQPGVRDRRAGAVPLAKDPVCGTYVVPGTVTLESRGTTHHFCSDACRRAFERGQTGSRTA